MLSLQARTLLAACSLFAACSLLAACGTREPARPPDTYRVRGIVRQLPVEGRAASELQVRHEAIPSFENAEGETVGMSSMTMPFPLADATLGAGLAVGDRIEMEFEVRWDSGHPLRITAIEKLPAETLLSFETHDAGNDRGKP